MKKILFYLFLFLPFIALAQMDVLSDQTRTAFIENIENPDDAISDANDHVPNILNSGPDIGAYDEGGDGLDYEYDDQDDNDCGIGATDGWEPVTHLENLARMAEGYALALDDDSDNSEFTIAPSLIRGLQYWYSLSEPNSPNYLNPNLNACPIDDPNDDDCDNMFPKNAAPPSMPWCCDNWWWNIIGKRRELAKIGILFYDQLSGTNAPIVPNSNPTKTILQAIVDDMPDNIEKHSNDPVETDKYTGANLTEVTAFVMMKGILSHDYSNSNLDCTNILVNLAITEFEDGALIPASQVACDKYDDGVQADNSFFQHNRILYNSGYGFSFIRSISLWGSALSGNSCFGFDQEHQDFLINAVLDGWRWMVRGTTSDYSVSGRYITRDGGDNHASIPTQHLIWLVELAEGVGYDCLPVNHPNYVAPVTAEGIALELMKNNASAGNPQDITGSKYFWIGDYVAYHQPTFFSSVKMCAKDIANVPECDGGTDDINIRTGGTESRNGDNEKGYWLPYGCTFIYRTGNEYDGIFDQSSGSDFDWNKIPGVTSAELSSSDLKPGKGGKAEINYHNSNFVGSAGNGDYAVTTMELDKNYPDVDDDLLTARKAWFHFGDEIIALGGDITDDSGEEVVTTLNQCNLNGSVVAPSTVVNNQRWIHHDQTAYIFQHGVTGYADQIEHSDDDGIFLAYVDHGNNIENSATNYFYRVVPGIASTEVSTYIQNNEVKILINQDEGGSFRQAVKKGDLVGIINYPPTSTTTTYSPYAINIKDQTDPLELSTNHPCALLYDETNGQICISSPDRKHPSIVLTATSNQGQDDITFNLPTGDLAGQSICINFSMNGAQPVHFVQTHCPSEEGISDVSILFEDNTAATTTDFNGHYLLPVISLATNEEEILTPLKDDNTYQCATNGVTAHDVILIKKHILRIDTIRNPYKLIAADANRSNNITSYDLIHILWAILDHTSNGIYRGDFPDNTSWRFVDADYVFPDPENPWLEQFPESFTVMQTNNLGLHSQGGNFKGIKIGDVNCTADNSQTAPCSEGIEILLEEKGVRKDEVFTWPVKVEKFKDIAAYQFAIRFAPSKLEYVEIKQGDLNKGAEPDNFNVNTVNSGLIKTLWSHNNAQLLSNTVIDTTLSDSSSLFILKFKAKEDIPSLSAILTVMGDSDFPAGAWKADDDCMKKVNAVYLPNGSAGTNSEKDSKRDQVDNVTIYPNPAKEELVFQISSGTSTQRKLQVLNTLGEIVYHQDIVLEKGETRFILQELKNWQSGIYLFTITDDEGYYHSDKFVKQ